MKHFLPQFAILLRGSHNTIFDASFSGWVDTVPFCSHSGLPDLCTFGSSQWSVLFIMFFSRIHSDLCTSFCCNIYLKIIQDYLLASNHYCHIAQVCGVGWGGVLTHRELTNVVPPPPKLLVPNSIFIFWSLLNMGTHPNPGHHLLVLPLC